MSIKPEDLKVITIFSPKSMPERFKDFRGSLEEAKAALVVDHDREPEDKKFPIDPVIYYCHITDKWQIIGIVSEEKKEEASIIVEEDNG